MLSKRRQIRYYLVMMRCILGMQMRFATATDFVILRGRYLIQRKPKLPASSFIRFGSEFRKTAPKNLKATEVSPLVGAAWKKMSAEEKKKYQDQFQAERKEYEIAKKKYDEKYKSNFKRMSQYNLFTKDYYKTQKGKELSLLTFKERSKIVYEEFSKLPQETLAKYKQRIEAIQQKQNKSFTEHQIPQFKYFSFRAFKSTKTDPLQTNQSLWKQFQAQRLKYQQTFNAWLKKKELTIEEFNKILKKAKNTASKKIRKESLDKEEQEFKIQNSAVTKSLNKLAFSNNFKKDSSPLKKKAKAKSTKDKVQSINKKESSEPKKKLTLKAPKKTQNVKKQKQNKK